MHWQDEAIILNIRRHGENHAIAELFARQHGRWRGMAHGGASRAKRAWLQAGNVVQAAWRARTAEQLGAWTLEPRYQPAAAALADSRLLAVLQALLAGLALCPERAPYPRLFDGARLLLRHLEAGGADAAAAHGVHPLLPAALLARFELALLAELGYGLDLSRCALTGATEDLAWVSPKSGRAASREAGAPWAEKLLPLPAFLRPARGGPDDDESGNVPSREPTAEEVAQGLRLTAHFLRRHLFSPQGRDLPAARLRLPELLDR